MIKKTISGLIYTLLAISLIFAFYPIQMPQYTLTNGKQTIVFQGMIHVANKDFYEKVEKDIYSYTANGYVFLYEGVRPGKKEKESIAPSYNDRAYLMGLVSQGGSGYFNIAIPKGYNADVDDDFLNDELVRLKLIDNKNELKEKYEPGMTKKEIDSLGPMLPVIRFFGLAFSRAGGRINFLQEYLAGDKYFDDDKFMYVIVVERNQYLLSQIHKVKGDRIYINYGEGHFSNLLKQLQAEDPNWHIANVKYYSAY